MPADSEFYGTLMLVAGKGGNLDLVAALQSNMEIEGLRPCRVSRESFCFWWGAPGRRGCWS